MSFIECQADSLTLRIVSLLLVKYPEHADPSRMRHRWKSGCHRCKDRLTNTIYRWATMDEDREKGRIVGTATKRKASVAYAQQVLPHVRAAVLAARRSDRGESLRAIADLLNQREIKSQKGKTFRAQTVSRLLYQTEDHIRDAADFEYQVAAGMLRYKAKALKQRLDATEIAELKAERDRIIAEGVELCRQMRAEDVEL
jgi:hypothetical protein